MIDAQTMKRLAFIRLLHQQGVEQSNLPEPLTFTAVLSFHDAVEHFLILAGEHLGATLPDHISFMKYWTELHPNKLTNGVDLSGRVAMDRLNRLRNGFKHAGALPGLAAIEQARADVSAFFEDNTPRVFDLVFATIDMADLIPQPTARDRVKSASNAISSGDVIEAMALLVEAFDDMVNPHVQGDLWGDAPFSFGPRISYPMRRTSIEAQLRPARDDRTNRPVRGAEKLAEQIDWVTQVSGEVQKGLRLLALGIDFRQYYRFRQLTPSVYLTGYGDRNVTHAPHYSPAMDEFDFCRQFVITTALRVAELEVHLAPPSWEQKQENEAG
ncbi:hypothetical protein [Micromonospora chalcea]|uniref:hypothetical protein n=1 Tax=Micromonospora chalcea TaxID=1874 RepID=UPI0037CB45DA